MQIRKKGGMKFKKSSLKLLSQSQPNFAEMILRWSPFKIVSVSAVAGKKKLGKSSKFIKKSRNIC
jgi:hypothetical protein